MYVNHVVKVYGDTTRKTMVDDGCTSRDVESAEMEY